MRARARACPPLVEAGAAPPDEAAAMGSEWDEKGGQIVNTRESEGGRFAPKEVNERNRSHKSIVRA